jgi:hypothetical protein
MDTKMASAYMPDDALDSECDVWLEANPRLGYIGSGLVGVLQTVESGVLAGLANVGMG